MRDTKMMRHILPAFFAVFALAISAPAAYAGTNDKTVQRGNISVVDKKKKSIIVNNQLYKLRHAVKIHDIEQKFPSVLTLKPGMTIEFMTRNNRRSGKVEISEIWVLYF